MTIRGPLSHLVPNWKTSLGLEDPNLSQIPPIGGLFCTFRTAWVWPLPVGLGGWMYGGNGNPRLLSRSPTAVYWLPPTAEGGGDTGVSASGQRHTKYTNRKHKNKKCTIPNSKFQIHTTGTARRLCHLPIHESDGKVQITTLILSDQLRCLTTTALRI